MGEAAVPRSDACPTSGLQLQGDRKWEHMGGEIPKSPGIRRKTKGTQTGGPGGHRAESELGGSLCGQGRAEGKLGVSVFAQVDS